MASDQVLLVLKQRLESAISERDGLQVSISVILDVFK